MLDKQCNFADSLYAPRSQAPINPGSRLLRRAIRKNIVSFPSQIPVSSMHLPDAVQWRMVLLYFVRGWSQADIAGRFKVPKHRVFHHLNNWAVRALALGYVEIIDPEAFADCCRADNDDEIDTDSAEIPLAASSPALAHVPNRFPEFRSTVNAPIPLSPLRRGTPDPLVASSVQVLGALDTAISHCEGWDNAFWARTATLLRDLKTVAAAALDSQQSLDQAEERVTTLGGGQGELQHSAHARDEERISHAVA